MPFSLGPRACYGVRLAVSPSSLLKNRIPDVPRFESDARVVLHRQMLELLVATALISQSFFLEALPEHLADPHETRVKEMITRRPIETWIKPRDW